MSATAKPSLDARPFLPDPDRRLPEEYEELLSTALTEAVLITGATSGHLALVDLENGEMVVHLTLGQGWTPETARMRFAIARGDEPGIVARVATTGKPYRTGNVQGDPYYYPLIESIRSELCVPILDRRGRTLGVLNLESTRADDFDERDEELVQELAERCASALVAADFAGRLQALIEIGRHLSEVRDVLELLDMVAEVATHILQSSDSSIFVLTDDRQRLVLQASHGALSQQLTDTPPSYALGEGLTGWVAQHAQSICIDDPTADSRWRGLHNELPVEQTGAFLAVPILGRDGTLGVIRVVRRRAHGQAYIPDEFTESDEQLLWTLASQIGVALDNAELFDRALQAERLAAWGELSARAQHMIGNVVFGLKGHLGELDYLLNEESDNRHEALEIIGRARRGLDRLERIMAEFRSFVMATRLSPEVLDLNELVQRTTQAVLGGKAEVQLTVQLDESLPLLRGDPEKLRAALGELLENAVAAQQTAPAITVAVARATASDLRKFGLPPQDDAFVRLSVSDHGPGVNGKARGRLFAPFFSTKSQGMGLGLSIVRGIIEAHRGYIRELGTPGQGADFVILLPLNAAGGSVGDG